ncbi:MAG: SMI1/KNR4 family protein [Ruminococcaceae bacterium]|nr:SMI1/KNR4 family protein [Oscillospiraceae bacterium]
MNMKEKILWILDKPGTTMHDQEAVFHDNIAFVHSLGLKCDCVGWSKLDPKDERLPIFLEKISDFCAENGWRARCWYERTYDYADSEWYELVCDNFTDDTFFREGETADIEGHTLETFTVSAYRNTKISPKMWYEYIFLPERFRDYCIANGINGFDYCYVKDKGKYDAEQYFQVYGRNLIPRIGVDFELKDKSRDNIISAGGSLPALSKVFHTMQYVHLQDCYLRSDLPTASVAYAYIPRTNNCAGRHKILIHRALANELLKEKVLSKSSLRSAVVVDELPGGYILENTQHVRRPQKTFMDSTLCEYDKLKKVSRPVRAVTENEALKILRSAKRERKEDFSKAYPKAKIGSIAESKYARLSPYYLISDGGYLSDEYRFLSFANAVCENTAFLERMKGEELLLAKPQGIVIAVCANGDSVLLCEDGSVVRYSHEEPTVIEKWQNIPTFFADVLSI